ncbi:MAG: restriction endonuclease subunit S [bacterium]
MYESWPLTPLGEILIERQETPDPLALETGEIRIVSKITFDKGQLEFRINGKTKTKMILIRPGDLVLSGINAAKGAIAIYPDEEKKPASATIHYGTYEVKKNKADKNFFWWLLRSNTFQEILSENLPGGIKTELKAKRLLPIKIPLPPLSEQRRIVAKIERLAAKIEEAKRLRTILNGRSSSLRNSVVEKLCFNSTYKVIKFGDALHSATNGIYKPPEFWGSGLPCIRMYNIEGPEMNTKEIQHLEVTDEELKKYGCTEGDLVFNRVNSAELVGKTGLITAAFPMCTFESKNMRIRVDKSKIVPAYAAIVLNSTPVKRYYREQLKQQCGMATLNQQHVKSIPFPLPSIDQQFGVIEIFDSLHEKVSSMKALQAKTETELNALLPCIIDKAFKGEL